MSDLSPASARSKKSDSNDQKETDSNGANNYNPSDSKKHEKLRNVTGDTVMKRSAMGEYVAYPPLSGQALPTPSPLDYAPKTKYTGYHYTLSGRNSKPFWSCDEGSVAGPAQFNTSSVYTKLFHGPAFSIGHKNDVQITDEDASPGPLAYDVQYLNLSNSQGKSCRITGKPKSSLNVTYASPGPNVYLPNKPELHQSPKYSFGTKSVSYLEVTPGPSDYETKKSLIIKYPNAPSATLKTTGHGNDEKTEPISSHVPAPNSYYPKSSDTKKVASLKGRYSDNKSSIKTPGPANYILSNAAYQSPKYTMTARNIPYQDDDYVRVVVPGPGDYNVNTEIVSRSRPKYSLGRRNPSFQREFQTPGPGQYDPKFQVIESAIPKVSMKGRHGQKSFATPGPSDYAVVLSPFNKLKESKGKKALAQKLRDLKKTLPTTNTAGPVEQNEKDSLTSPKLRNPGPADYDIRNKKSVGPAYSLRFRLESLKAVDSPGPNAYDVRKDKQGEKTKISLRSRHSPFVLVFPSTRFDTVKRMSNYSTPRVPTTRPTTARIYSATKSIISIPSANTEKNWCDVQSKQRHSIFPPLGWLEPSLLSRKLENVKFGHKGEIFSMIDNVTPSDPLKKKLPDDSTTKENPIVSGTSVRHPSHQVASKRQAFVPAKLEAHFHELIFPRTANGTLANPSKCQEPKSRKLDLTKSNKDEIYDASPDHIYQQHRSLESIAIFREILKNELTRKKHLQEPTQQKSKCILSKVILNENQDLPAIEDNLQCVPESIDKHVLERIREPFPHEFRKVVDDRIMETVVAHQALRDLYFAASMKDRVRVMDHYTEDRFPNNRVPAFEIPLSHELTTFKPTVNLENPVTSDAPDTNDDIQTLKAKIKQEILNRKAQESAPKEQVYYKVLRNSVPAPLVGGEPLSKKLYCVKKLCNKGL